MSNNKLNNDDEISFSITPYIGYEREIKKILDENRDEEFTHEYLDWRYLGEESPIPPLIFWVYLSKGPCIGMSALIFRAYWKNNKKIYLAVSGDTSISKDYRGKGIGKKLFKYITVFLEKNKNYGFGIGTPVVTSILSSIGWKKVDKLYSYVYLIDSSEKINEKINHKSLSKVLGYFYSIFCKVKLSFFNTSAYQLKKVHNFDHDFEMFWENFDKTGIILRDRSLPILEWRYLKHPRHTFTTLKFFKHNTFIGFLIYRTDDNYNITIYDVLVNRDESAMVLSLFIKYFFKKKKSHKLEMILINETHFLSGMLQKVGFFMRTEDIFLQMLTPDGLKEIYSSSILVTQGDKDI
ncbi:GNAT family N-acetyltransferase [Desulfobacula sp.]|uniref:GNAT family N-acetyltransferase n=1 Tax=Desulfobacula sp. TaxID=2593537 RepID=UPI001ECEA80A|nr:GNAT family N-acetyltransferase [Desulfobacula sp.]